MKIDYKNKAEKINAFFQKAGCVFDQTIKTTVTAVDPEEKSVTLEFTVNEASLNQVGIMHGGAIAWMADLAMADAISTYGEAFGTTADMSVDFIRPLPLGTKVTVKGYAVNLGGFLRRSRAEFLLGSDIVASATGNYTGWKMLSGLRIGYIDSRTTKVEDDFVRFFILEGSKKALVIDSGVSGARDVKYLAENISGLPASLIHTHADPDHIAGNSYFDSCLMHKADKALYDIKSAELGGSEKGFAKARFVKDGDVIDLGERQVEVIHIPGHTKGSIALLDVNERVLYGGDTVQDGEIYMFGSHRNMDDYIASLEKLNAMKDRFDIIRTSHDTMDLKPAVIGRLLKAAKTVRAGKAEAEIRSMYGTQIAAYDMGCATFLCDK